MSPVAVGHPSVAALVARPGEERGHPKRSAPRVRVIRHVNRLRVRVGSLDIHSLRVVAVERNLQGVVMRVEEALKLIGACRATPFRAQGSLLVDSGCVEVEQAPAMCHVIADVSDPQQHLPRQLSLYGRVPSFYSAPFQLSRPNEPQLNVGGSGDLTLAHVRDRSRRDASRESPQALEGAQLVLSTRAGSCGVEGGVAPIVSEISRNHCGVRPACLPQDRVSIEGAAKSSPKYGIGIQLIGKAKPRTDEPFLRFDSEVYRITAESPEQNCIRRRVVLLQAFAETVAAHQRVILIPNAQVGSESRRDLPAVQEMEPVPCVLAVRFLELYRPACLIINAEQEGRKLIDPLPEEIVIRRNRFTCRVEKPQKGVVAAVKAHTTSRSEAILGLPVVQVIVNDVNSKAEGVVAVRP